MKETSKQAYRQIATYAPVQRDWVFNVLKRWSEYYGHGFTSESLSQFLDAPPYETVKRRMGELEKLGLVKDSGKRAKTSSGRNAIIWEIVRNPLESSTK